MHQISADVFICTYDTTRNLDSAHFYILKPNWDPTEVSPDSQTSSISFSLLSLSWPFRKGLRASWHAVSSLRLCRPPQLLTWSSWAFLKDWVLMLNKALSSFHFSVLSQLLLLPCLRRCRFFCLKSGVAWCFWGELEDTYTFTGPPLHSNFTQIYWFNLLFSFLNCTFLYMQLGCKNCQLLQARRQYQSQHHLHLLSSQETWWNC